jgi:hypothetical protein
MLAVDMFASSSSERLALTPMRESGIAREPGITRRGNPHARSGRDKRAKCGVEHTRGMDGSAGKLARFAESDALITLDSPFSKSFLGTAIARQYVSQRASEKG